MKSSLREYNKKRDFKKTKEPSGKSKKKKSKKPIFVIQEHHARRLHYDFRLELDGVLKSWAVPKGPSLDPKDKRLAVQTEDHPLEYAKFHGTIPQGEYGGGEVFIWDKGTWESLDEDPREALQRGHLKFKISGKKLKGSFVLVRTSYRDRGDKKNWLLIKHADEEAPVKKAPVKKKALGKDPWPGFIKPQLARLVEGPPEEEGWVHELKFDGYRMEALLKDGIAQFYTRNELEWSNAFPHLLNAVEKLPCQNAILDGEIVAMDEKGKTNFQLLQNSLKGKNDKSLRYYIFDLLYLNGKDLRDLPYIERKELLKELLKGTKNYLFLSEHFESNGQDFFRVSCEHGLEGIISKQKDAPYSSGRGDLWLKSKCSERQEFVIGGWSEPRGSREGIGALLLGVYEDGKLRYAGRVGTGFNHATLKSLKKELSVMEQEESPFDLKSPKGKDIHWVKPGKICEVSFGNWTDEGILRTPVFQGMREDKKAREVHMEKPKKKKQKAQVSISSPEKVLFEKEKITKKEVAQFYQKIAKVMLPYVQDRPLSLVRCPNGTSGTCFFQKHVSGSIPESFHTFPIEEEKGEGIYLSIDSSEGLQALAQMNAFEIHAWNCQRDDYLHPDQIVMDFDPGPGVPWREVVSAAFELRELLGDLNLESFVKLTGGKGLHVHVPILPLYDWDQVKSFAQGLALELVSRNPKKYVANMSKKLRKGKIFVDYLRNGYGATAVVPYSLRARDLSTVALPLEWSELKKIKGPQEFTMKRAQRKILARKKDPWSGMLKLKQRIEILKPVQKIAA
jgi:bifunctional non-homologous end joining protein LigD